MSPPDAQEPPARGSFATLFDSAQGTPGGAPAEALPRCWVCAAVTLRIGEDGRPVHAACEPADVYATAPETSHKAARKARKGVRSPLARKIHAHLAAHPEGLTDDELCQLMPGEPPGSISKRRLDLCRAGRVESLVVGLTRTTRWGGEAQVWFAAFPEDPL